MTFKHTLNNKIPLLILLILLISVVGLVVKTPIEKKETTIYEQGGLLSVVSELSVLDLIFSKEKETTIAKQEDVTEHKIEYDFTKFIISIIQLPLAFVFIWFGFSRKRFNGLWIGIGLGILYAAFSVLIDPGHFRSRSFSLNIGRYLLSVLLFVISFGVVGKILEYIYKKYKSDNYWFFGGSIGLVIGLISLTLGIVVFDILKSLFFQILTLPFWYGSLFPYAYAGCFFGTANYCDTIVPGPALAFGFFVNSVIYFLIGALIGLIVEKIKSKNDAT